MYLGEYDLGLINLYHPLGKFSRRQIGNIFLTLNREQDLTFHAMQLSPWRQFA